MPSEASLFIAFFIVSTVVILVLVRVTKGRSEAKEEDLRRAAMLRGWTFEEKTERGFGRPGAIS